MRNGRAMVRRVDKTQRQIKQQLETALIQVWVIGEPCDLLLRFWCNRHHDFCWQPLEIKTPQGKRAKARVRADQKEQAEFLADTRTPAVTTFEEAWWALNHLHRLEGVHLQTHLRPVSEVRT
jgi:hypothetical protein